MMEGIGRQPCGKSRNGARSFTGAGGGSEADYRWAERGFIGRQSSLIERIGGLRVNPYRVFDILEDVLIFMAGRKRGMPNRQSLGSGEIFLLVVIIGGSRRGSPKEVLSIGMREVGMISVPKDCVSVGIQRFSNTNRTHLER